jgi:hypothetical protein
MTGQVERLIRSKLYGATRPTQTHGHLAAGAFNEEGDYQLRVATWDSGHVEVIDDGQFDGIAEDDHFYYVTRFGGLVRFPK